MLHFAWVCSKRLVKYAASVEVAEKHVRVNAHKKTRPVMKVVRWNKERKQSLEERKRMTAKKKNITKLVVDMILTLTINFE